MERPGIYAPYQPRFEWNLWFASLGPWQASPWVVSRAGAARSREARACSRSFGAIRSADIRRRLVRTVLWQYWFTDAATKRATGAWWTREFLGDFAGVVSRDSIGRVTFTPASGE